MNKYLFSLFYKHDDENNKTFSPIRFAKNKNNTQCWQGYGEMKLTY